MRPPSPDPASAIRACALGAALRLLLVLGLAAIAPRAHAADDPVDNVTSAPPWFKDLADLVLTNSAAAKRRAEAKLAEAHAAHDPATEAYARLMLGHAARRQNDIPGALAHSRAALALAEHPADPALLFNTHYTHALNLRAAGDDATAVDHLLRSLQLAETRLSSREQSTAAAALGSTYERLGDFPHALDYQQRALTLAEQLGDDQAVGRSVQSLAALKETLGDLAGARRDYQRALALRRAEGNRTNLADVEESLAMLDFAEGRAEQALAALNPILAQRRTLRGKAKLTSTLGYLAEVLVKLGRLDEALAFVTEAQGYASAIDSRGLRANTYRRLARVHEARGDLAAALAATRSEFAEREAMSGEAAKNRAAELQVLFDVAQKDNEITRLAQQNHLQTDAAQARAAQLAEADASLRAKNAELHAAAADLAGVRHARLALLAAALAALVLLGAVVLVQRTRLRAERRILADTRAARDAAQQADVLKGRLLNFASHDLKAPLATISAATHLLEESAHQPAEVLTLAGAMRAETTRMVHLVHDFIDRAAIDAGRLELRPVPTNLARVAAQITADFRPHATQKKQTLSFDEPPSPLPLVSAEAARLEQVLANLLSNAINYTPKGGTIRVALGHHAAGVWCEVTDSGPGIRPEEVATLFQPFARLSTRPTNGESSSGLGLFLAAELVRLHAGKLTVQSPPAGGTTFRLTLPALPA